MLITGSNFLDAFTCKSVPGTFTFGMFGNLLLGGGVASIILEFSIPNKEPIPDLSLDLFLGSSFLSFDFRYVIPCHRVTKRKQISGRIILKI